MPTNSRRENVPRYVPPMATTPKPAAATAAATKDRPRRDLLDPAENAAIGGRIGAAIAAAGLTRRAAARKMGVSHVAVTYWCSGASLPNLQRLVRAVDVLGLDPAILFPEWFRGR